MKRAYLLPFLMTVSLPLMAKTECHTDAIVYKNETGFSLSFGSKGSSSNLGNAQTVNVPLSINGQEACFVKKTKFEVSAEDNKKKSTSSIVINPLEVEFKNVPQGHVKQYLFVERDPENDILTKFHLMSFICSGDTPLSIEASSDSFFDVVLKRSASQQVNTVFATGAAAQILKEAQPKSSSQPTFDFFSKLYALKTKHALEEAPLCDYNVPSLITDTSIDAIAGVHRKMVSTFSTMGERVVNGCTKDFSESMKSYQVENYLQNESLKDYKIKKKKKSLVLSWEKK